MRSPARRVTVAIAALLGAILLSFALRPRPTQNQAARAVTVGVYQNAPKIYTDARGRPAGLFVDLLQAMADSEGWNLRFVPCTWAACLQSLTDGQIDVMPDVAYSDERAKRFDFHAVAAANSWSQIYRNRQVEIRAIGDLERRRVAVLHAAIQEDYLKQLFAGAGLHVTLVPVEDYAQGFAAVRDGLADAVVTNAFYGGRFAFDYGLVETPIMFNPVGLYYATGKAENAALLQRIDHYLAQWRKDQDSIYFTAMRAAMMPPPMTVVPRWLRLALAGTATVVLLLLVFSFLLRWQVKRATSALYHAHRRLDQVLDASPVVLYLLRPENGSFVAEWVSPNIERLFGFSPAHAQERGWLEKVLHDEDRETVLANLERLSGQRGQLTQEYRIRDAKGRTRYIHEELRFTSEIDGQGEQVVGTWTDLTQAVKHAAELRFLSQYEPVTGLPNRARLHERLTKVLARAGRKNARVALLAIDLEGTRDLNDMLGHVKGDALLRAAARKIEALTGIDDMLATVGDESFVLVLGGETSAQHAAATAERLLQIFAQPLSPEHPLRIPAGIGISLFPDDAADADTLLEHADLALADAKKNGRNTYRAFAAALTAGAKERMRMATDLRGAVSRHELVLHYQPQLDLHGGQVSCVEALVRWNHPESGVLPPDRFLPLAQDAGTVHELCAWILREACRQMRAWQDAGLPLGRVAVNLSAAQFLQPALPALVADVLQTTGLDRARLELEIAEATILREPERAVAVMRELKALGVCLTIDDFGTSESSLAFLKRVPVDRIKIDQTFVRDIGRDPNDEAICRSVIELGRGLGLEAVAEGVEREEQAAFLRAEGCGFAQGFLFGRPLPAEALPLAWGQRMAMPRGG